MVEKSGKEDNREYTDKYPFLSEIVRRISDINDAVRNGMSGVVETRNLITNIPKNIRSEESIKEWEQFKKEYNERREQLQKLYITGTTESYKRHVDSLILIAGQDYSLNVKESVINLLNSPDINMLLQSRRKVPEGQYVDMHDIDPPKDET